MYVCHHFSLLPTLAGAKVSLSWVMCMSPLPLELRVTAMTSGEDHYLTLIAY